MNTSYLQDFERQKRSLMWHAFIAGLLIGTCLGVFLTISLALL